MHNTIFYRTTALALALGLTITPVVTGCSSNGTPEGLETGVDKVDVSQLGEKSSIGDNVRLVDYGDVSHRLRGRNPEQAKLIDVRTVVEYQMSHVRDATNVPLSTIKMSSPKKLRKLLPAHGELWIYCRSGGRAQEAARTIHAAMPERQILVVVDNFDNAQVYGLEIVT